MAEQVSQGLKKNIVMSDKTMDSKRELEEVTETILGERVAEGSLSATEASAIKESAADVASEIIMKSELFSGPLPPPGVLKEYETVCPGAARDIVNMMKEEGRARRFSAKCLAIAVPVGILVGGIICLGGFYCSVLLAREGLGGKSIAAIFAAVGVVIASIWNSNSRKSKPIEENDDDRLT